MLGYSPKGGVIYINANNGGLNTFNLLKSGDSNI